ncbi:hypothetical protein MAR_023116, partial [Mya arenaria]
MDRELNSLFVLLILNILTNAAFLATENPVNGSANQSTTYNACSAEKAFDGEKKFNESQPSCTCSVTNNTSPRWWEMDLGSKYLIGSIVVTGRT